VLRRLLIATLTALTLMSVTTHARDGDKDRDSYRDRDRGPDRSAAKDSERDSDWTLLGEQTVDLSADKDTMTIGREEGRFSRVRVLARYNDIFLYSMTVQFGNGQEQTIKVNAMINVGERSGIFDLPGERRSIRKVTFLYKARPGFRGRTVVELYGLRANAEPARPPQPVVISDQSYDRRDDRINFRVPPGGTWATELKIKSIDEPISLESVEVRYANGRSENFEIYDRLGPGEEGEPIKLAAGDRSPINGVTVIKRPSWRGGEGRIALIGNGVGGPPSASPGVPTGQFFLVDSQTSDKRLDKITFRVDQRGRRLDQIKLRADDSITIEAVAIRFSNGEVQNIYFGDRLLQGEESRIMDVDTSGRKTVSEVVVSRRPSWRPGTTRMELLGLDRGDSDRGRDDRDRPSHGAEVGRAPPGWVLFGAKTVGTSVERDIIEIGNEVGRFSRIAVAVRDDDVYLREVTLIYGNGQRDTRQINTEIKANSRTRPLDIPGDRFIRQIEMVYQSRPGNRTNAVVEVFGEYDRKWLAEGRDGFQGYNRGWLMIGAQRALMFTTDSDAFQVGEQFGRFRAIRLTARRHAVRITGLRVTYSNGQVEEVPLFQELTDGQSTRDIDLRIRDRYIQRVDVRYRTKLNFLGEGLVELWGLK
jgi:hypothetical protein